MTYIMRTSVANEYLVDGLLHREDGPAVAKTGTSMVNDIALMVLLFSIPMVQRNGFLKTNFIEKVDYQHVSCFLNIQRLIILETKLKKKCPVLNKSGMFMENLIEKMVHYQ